VVEYRDLISIYEIFEEPIRSKIKMILKNHGHNNSLLKTQQLSEEVGKIKKSDFKQEILMNDSVQIDASVMYYRVKFNNKLKSDNYQLYGSLTTTSRQQVYEKIIKFKEKNIFGFSVIIENILDKNVKNFKKMNINWMLVGNPEIIEHLQEFENPHDESSNDRNLIVVGTGKKTIEPNNKQNWEISIDTIPILPLNAVFACTFKYPLSNNEPSFLASIKSYNDVNGTLIVNIANHTHNVSNNRDKDGANGGNTFDYDGNDDNYVNGNDIKMTLEEKLECQIYWCIYLTSTQEITIGQFCNNVDYLAQTRTQFEKLSNITTKILEIEKDTEFKDLVVPNYKLINEQVVLPESVSHVSCVDASFILLDEIKNIVINLRKSKKIFDPIIHSSSETVRALHYVKNEAELYFQQYEDAFNKYKISLENIKEFAKEVANIEKKRYLFFPYRHVKEKYEKLLKEHESCKKKLNPILIKVIINKQESQQDDFKNIHEILKTIPNDNKNEHIIRIETIFQTLFEKSILETSIPRIDSALLFEPPIVGDSKVNLENEPNRKSEWDLDGCVQTKIVKKTFKRIVEVACEPITVFEQNMSMLSELKRFDESRNILKFYGLSKVDDDEMLVFEWASLGSLKDVYEDKNIPWDLKVKIAYNICQGLLFLSHNDILHRDVRCENIMMNYYMEPKIANFYLAKHASEIAPDNDHISDHILSIINWAAPEMMQRNALYTKECEVFSFVMLLWELAFQKIPYKKMSKEDIIIHVTNGRRESSPDPRFYVLEFLNIQRKYLRIIVEGWNNKPEKRIKMDEILLRFLEIEADLSKPKRNNSGSAHSSDQLDQLSHTRTRAASIPVKPITFHRRREIPLKPKEREFKPDKPTTPDSPGFNPSPNTYYPKEPKKSRPSSLILTPSLEPVNELYPPYLTETPAEIDSFMINPETWQIEIPSKIELSNLIPPRSSIISSVNEPNKTSNLIKPDEAIEAPNKTSNLIKPDEAIEALNKTSNSIKPDEAIEAPNKTSNLIKPDEAIEAPNKTSNLIKPDEVIEAPSKTSDLIKPDEVIETSDKSSNSIKTEPIKEPNETPNLIETNEVNGTEQSKQSTINGPIKTNQVNETKPSKQPNVNGPSVMKVADGTKPSHEDDDYTKSIKSIKSSDYENVTKSLENDPNIPNGMKIPLDNELTLSDNDEVILSDSDNNNDEEMENNDPIPSDSEKTKSSEKPKPQNLQDIPSSISKKLNHGLIINTQKMQIAGPSACAFMSKPKMNVLDTIKFQAKLILSSKYKDSFLLENHIESPTDLDWISDANPQIDISQVNTVCLEIRYAKAEATFEKGSIEPSKELTIAIKKALKHRNPYRELMKAFDYFGHFLPNKVILGDKLYSISKNSSANQELTELKIDKEFKAADDFSQNCTDYNDIIKQWEKCIESHNLGSSPLTTINGNAVKKNKIKEWAISCLKKSSDSWSIISWEGLYPLYEILDADLCQEVKLCLGNDEQAIITGIKEKVLRSGVIPIENSQYQYSVKFDSPLESKNYQIFGKILTQSGTPFNKADVKFKSKDESGFSAIVEDFSNQFVPKPANDDTGIDSCEIQLKTSENLQSNAVIITSFKYPKSNYQQSFIAKVKDYRDKTIHINISVRKNGKESVDDDDEDFVEIPELNWCVLLLDDEDETNNLREIGQSVHANYLNSNNELDLSYKKLDTEIGNELVNSLKGNKTISSLDISYNNIGSKLGKALMKILVANDTLTRLNLSSTNIESDTLALLLKILKANKTRLADLNLSNNGEKLTKKGKILMEALGKNTTLISLNLSDNPIDWSDVSFVHLESNKTLENLDLSNCNLSPKVVEKLKKFLITSKRLKGLNLSSNNLTFLSERIISEILSKNKTIKTLNLSSNKISSTIESLEKGARTSLTGRYKSKSKYEMSRPLKVNNLAEAIKRNKTLKKLDLSSNYIRLEAGKDLARALASNKLITELNLNDNDIVHEIGELLINVLINNDITSIGLRSTKISSGMVINISQELKSNKIKLRYLNLSRNEISSDAMEALVEALEENTTLKSLDLSNITGAGQTGRALVKSLEKNRTLKTLNLSNCNIRNSVVTALEKALQTNDILTDLDLSYNALPMSNLIKALERNNSLTKLNISYRDFHLKEIEALANVLKVNDTITHLYLSRTMDDPENGKVLFEALEVNKKLTDLDLSRNNIREIEVIAKALLNNVSLRRVDLTSNQIEIPEYNQSNNGPAMHFLLSSTINSNIASYQLRIWGINIASKNDVSSALLTDDNELKEERNTIANTFCEIENNNIRVLVEIPVVGESISVKDLMHDFEKMSLSSKFGDMSLSTSNSLSILLKTTKTNLESINRILEYMKELSNNIKGFSDNIKGVLDNMKRVSDNMKGVSDNMKDVSDNMKEFSNNMQELIRIEKE
ncbi:13539_t:CDS:2, partial [Dentiscutata heterogama]